FEGKLTFEGTVRIDATFIGSITTNDVLVVGEHARIDAEITCGTIIVYGEVNGNIKAKTAVEIHQSAKVHSELETPWLVVEKGALFQGSVHMEPHAKVAAMPKPAVVSAPAPVEVETIAAAARATEVRPAPAAKKHCFPCSAAEAPLVAPTQLRVRSHTLRPWVATRRIPLGCSFIPTTGTIGSPLPRGAQ